MDINESQNVDHNKPKHDIIQSSRELCSVCAAQVNNVLSYMNDVDLKVLLFETIRINHLSCLKVLLSFYCRSRFRTVNSIQNGCGDTLLMNACVYNRMTIVEYLVEQNANINTTNIITGQNILYIASKYNHVPLVNYILQQSTFQRYNQYGECCALNVAAVNEHMDCMHILLEAGIRINDSVLIDLLWCGGTQSLEYLLHYIKHRKVSDLVLDFITEQFYYEEVLKLFFMYQLDLSGVQNLEIRQMIDQWIEDLHFEEYCIRSFLCIKLTLPQSDGKFWICQDEDLNIASNMRHSF